MPSMNAEGPELAFVASAMPVPSLMHLVGSHGWRVHLCSQKMLHDVSNVADIRDLETSRDVHL